MALTEIEQYGQKERALDKQEKDDLKDARIKDLERQLEAAKKMGKAAMMQGSSVGDAIDGLMD